jgi:Fur family ferric uptake transcriptional regulator
VDRENEKYRQKSHIVVSLVFGADSITLRKIKMVALKQKLEERGLRKTAFRVELLALFTQTKSSLSIENIKSSVGKTTDKVTIYRALDAFEKSGLIHRVPDKANLARYALCQECKQEAHVHNHAHFICNVCDETFCIQNVEVPKVRLKQGYKISASTLTLEGACPSCQSA